MSNLRKIFSIVSAVCAILLLSFAFYYIWTFIKATTLRECPRTVASEIVEYSHDIHDFARNDENWYVLTDEETKSVFSNERITFGGCGTLKSQPQDMNERNLKIAVKKNSKYGYRVMVWSRGFDNISGTEDDITSPFGEEVPK